MTPFCIVGHVGSINVGAIDDIAALADVAARHNLWLHLDGACGALGGMLPELASHFAAWRAPIRCRSTPTSGSASRTRRDA